MVLAGIVTSCRDTRESDCPVVRLGTRTLYESDLRRTMASFDQVPPRPQAERLMVDAAVAWELEDEANSAKPFDPAGAVAAYRRYLVVGRREAESETWRVRAASRLSEARKGLGLDWGPCSNQSPGR